MFGFFFGLLWLYWQVSLKIWQERGEETRSKGTRAGSQIWVRCRASVHAARALTTELHGIVDCSVFCVVWLAWDQLVKQWVMWEGIIECMYIMAAWVDREFLIHLKLARLNLIHLQTVFTCAPKLKLESRIMPRYLNSLTISSFSPDTRHN